MNKNFYKFILFASILFGISLVNLFVRYYGEWLWFEHLGYGSVFVTNISTQILSFVLFFFVFVVFAGFNLYYAFVNLSKSQTPIPFVKDNTRQKFASLHRVKSSKWPWIGITLFFGFIMGSFASGYWIDFLKFLHPSSFHLKEPIMNKDVGFYLFYLPLYQILLRWYFTALVLSSVLVLFFYNLHGLFRLQKNRVEIKTSIKKHLLLLGAFFALGVCAHYILSIYNLLYSSNGAAFGASYADVHAQIPAYKTIVVVTAILTLLLFSYPFHKKVSLVGGALSLWLVVLVGFVWIYPSLMERYIVKPTELQKETPYIANNIQFTSKAYGLDKIQIKPFAADNNASYRDILENHNTIENIRLWDRRPLLQTYKQLQEIRLYYDFKNIAVDRYRFDKYTEVAAGVRELPVSNIPSRAQTWVNRHLIYTHGYGIVMNPVNEITPNGMPNLIVKDIPPHSSAPLKLDQTAIYYGEATNQFVLVDTKAKEFDYPKGEKNVYTHYKGDGGVEISSLFRRFVYAWKFSDIDTLFTSYLQNKSRIMFHRNITERAATLAPFLAYDKEPYAVVGKDGKIYWILDTYTTSDMYPYAEPLSGNPIQRGVNYIKNSVKVVIDAYNGDVSFYALDSDDALLQTYEKIYPKLFKPFEKMPKFLQAHIRYPTDLFDIQVKIYNAYHMTDPKVFYNQEDYWQIPNVIYQGVQQKMVPYYIIMRLPDMKKEEYILMLPLNPSTKDNMVAWMCARCDIPHYGDLIVYTLPKEKLIYGPMQIEARINQKPEISAELTLWGQQGSRVIKGNQLVIPIKNSFIYVEPVYLQSEEGQIPQLKRVIVAFKDKIAMRKTLYEALQAVFGVSIPNRAITKTPTTKKMKEARKHYNQAMQFLQQGNWVDFGKEMQQLQTILSASDK